MCIKELQEYVAAFQERRAKVTDEVVEQYMARRPLKWGGNPNPIAVVSTTAVQPDGDANEGEGEGGEVKMTKNQLKKLQKLKQAAEKKAQKLGGKSAEAEGSSKAPE